MSTIAIQQLKAHPAQMRTTYDLETLAALTLQVYERGLDQWQPIAATPHPGLNGAEGGDGYHIVSGHRRHMAQLLAFALRDWAKEHPDTEITIEVGRTMLTALVESLGSLEALIASLLGKYGAEEIPFVLFEGSQKAQILALQAANYGSDQLDMLGVAHSFRQALLAGATPEEIARNCGQHVHFVRNHLALADIPPDLAQRIAAGDLPLSVATAVADLPEPRKTGLSIFILANPSTSSGQAPSTSSGQAPSTSSGQGSKLTARDIKECAAALKKWPGLQLPLMSKHQSQRNIARALVALWGQALAAFPEDAYAAASMFIFRGVHDEPWAAQEKLTLWFQALGGDTYFSNGSIHWAAIVQYLVPEVSCETCPIKQLPQEQLRSDLSGGQGGPLGMPCRVAEDGPRCIHGLAANDPVDVRVPWDWSQHPGVVKDGADYRVKSYEALLAAWQAQQAKELAEDEESEKQQAEAEKAKGKRQRAESAPAGQGAALGQGAAMGAATATADNQEETANAKPAPDAPIVKQREFIAQYMQQHERFNVSHAFATACAGCRHKLEKSPTKPALSKAEVDEDVPHCAWAGRLRGVAFKQLVSELAGAPQILVCRQFAPNQPWAERIPAHPAPGGLPREWLKAQILHLVEAANRHGSNSANRANAFEFLTGRPMGANENYGDWFQKQLSEQSGELSDAQLFTLLVWAFAEWQRAQNGRFFSLPVNGQSMQFADYSEQQWEPGEKH